MKTIKIFLVLILLNGICHSQKNLVSLTGNINRSFRTPPDKPASFIGTDTRLMLYDAGIDYGRKLANRLYVMTGIYFSAKGYSRSPFYDYGGEYYYKYEYKKIFNYLELPLGVKIFLVKKNKFRLNADAGFLNQLLLHVDYKPANIEKRPAIFINPNEPNPAYPRSWKIKRDFFDNYGYRSYSFGVYGALEVQYKLGEFFVGLSPCFKYSVSQIAGHARLLAYELPGEHLYSFALALKIAYEF